MQRPTRTIPAPRQHQDRDVCGGRGTREATSAPSDSAQYSGREHPARALKRAGATSNPKPARAVCPRLCTIVVPREDTTTSAERKRVIDPTEGRRLAGMESAKGGTQCTRSPERALWAAALLACVIRRGRRPGAVPEEASPRSATRATEIQFHPRVAAPVVVAAVTGPAGFLLEKAGEGTPPTFSVFDEQDSPSPTGPTRTSCGRKSPEILRPDKSDDETRRRPGLRSAHPLAARRPARDSPEP